MENILFFRHFSKVKSRSFEWQPTWNERRTNNLRHVYILRVLLRGRKNNDLFAPTAVPKTCSCISKEWGNKRDEQDDSKEVEAKRTRTDYMLHVRMRYEFVVRKILENTKLLLNALSSWRMGWWMASTATGVSEWGRHGMRGSIAGINRMKYMDLWKFSNAYLLNVL